MCFVLFYFFLFLYLLDTQCCPSGVADRQPVSGAGRIIQPSDVAGQQPISVGGRIVHNDPAIGRGPQSPGVADRQTAGHLPHRDVSTRGGPHSPTSSIRL